MNNKQKLGKKGEDLVVAYLENMGYKIIERNFFCKLGEIDIIAKEKNTIVFLEVKTRRNRNYGTPAEAVNKRKKLHIYNSAKYYISIKKLKNIEFRFDVVEVIYRSGKYEYNHIKQIF